MKRYEIKGGGFTRYFDLIYYNKGKPDEKFTYGRERHDVINEEIRPCGYFVIITSEKMTAAQALGLYKGRDASEKLFRGDKSYLGNKSFRVHTSESVHAKIFIPAGNEPSGHACMSIWRLPRGANTPQLCCAASLMPRSLLRGI